MTESALLTSRRWPAVLALAGSAVVYAAPRLTALPQNPLGWGLGPTFTTPIFTALAIVGLLGAVLAVRWPAAATALLTAAVAGLILLAAVEFEPAVLLIGLPLVVAAGALAVSLRSRWSALAAALAGLVVVALVAAIGREIYLSQHGPTHPASTVPAPDWHAEWLWVGGVTADSATITAGGLGPVDHTLEYWSESDAVGAVVDRPDEYGIARFELTGLTPNTPYRYRVGETADVTGAPQRADSSFRTYELGPQDLTIIAGASSRTGSNGVVFDRMRAEEPDLYLNLGDLHYANLVSDDPGDHVTALGRSLSTPAQSALVSSVPTTWVWDDHDFGDNDSDSSSPSRDAASAAYRAAAPHYGVDSDPAASIGQAFTVGRVRVVLTDTRSMRTSASMLGAEQLDWFLDELTTSARSHAVVVWGNPNPWITADEPGSDPWGGFPDERRRIADAVAAAEIDNLVMVSGDAHMVAIDDGTNSGYATDGSAGFPVLHAAPLDRPGSVKGGPYSHGSFSEAGQYGKVQVVDDGGPTVHVRLSGQRWDGTELVSLDLEFAAAGR